MCKKPSKMFFPLALLTGMLVFSGCHFSRNNPNDIGSPDYAGVSIMKPGDSALVSTDSLVAVWQGQGEVAEFNYRLDNAAWVSLGTETSVVLRNLEEGDHFLEIRVTNKKGRDSTAGVTFFVNAMTGPSILISPQITKVLAADTAVSITVNLEEVASAIGVNAVMVFDHSKIAFTGSSSSWSFFKADTLGSDTLELSAACLDSVNGFSGSGALAVLTFRLVDSSSPADIAFLAGKSELTLVNGASAQFRNLRKGSISR